MASQSTLESPDRSNLVAYWSVPLLDGVHTVEFDHGTTSGKRVLRIDGKEVLHKDWMFKLVGDIKFTLGKHETKCELRVDPIAHFAFSYSLWVDGLPLEKYCEQQEKVMKSWSVVIKGKRFRIVLDKRTLNVWVDGDKIEPETEFVETGSQYKFYVEEEPVVIKSASNGKKKEVAYNLFVNNMPSEDDKDVLI